MNAKNIRLHRFFKGDAQGGQRIVFKTPLAGGAADFAAWGSPPRLSPGETGKGRLEFLGGSDRT